MKRTTRLALFLIGIVVAGLGWALIARYTPQPPPDGGAFLGSAACRDCHESFYEKWATSWHGLAMQPYTAEFGRKSLTPQETPLEIRGKTYQAVIGHAGASTTGTGTTRTGTTRTGTTRTGTNRTGTNRTGTNRTGTGETAQPDAALAAAAPDETALGETALGETGAFVVERGPDGEKRYPIVQVLGGKNLYYFLTPFRNGRLQVLPLAYDVHEKAWYDSAGSMVRHFQEQPDTPVEWTDRALTFNTSCYTCHVSQITRNYHFETDSYRTTWTEPGINCESCHGPGRKHVEVSLAAKAKGKDPDPLEIIVTRDFTHEQTNAMCGFCHAKMVPLTEGFIPGERFFDHFNLTTIEDRDLYPDGRELGENYTYGPFLISACAQSGRLDCMHCHTSSGRNKYPGPGPDQDKACLPCHADIVAKAAEHSFHEPESEGTRCVNCHMPMTVFARMRRHDHTMLPPTPASTLEFGAPNGCNLCHTDKDAKWADDWVRKWYPRDYQAPILARARLVDMARKRDWSKLEDMLAYIESKERNEFYASGLLRLLQGCPDPRKWRAYHAALEDPSPLVRASAAAGLDGSPDAAALAALVEAAGDEFRVVRVEAAMGLARAPIHALDPAARKRVEKAFGERMTFLRNRPDDPMSHYNLANFLADRGDPTGAVRSFEDALRLDPGLVPALVNLSMVHARLGDTVRAEMALRQALRSEPASQEANFNLGLLLAEEGREAEAETCFRLALAANPRTAQVAYNLAVLLADRSPAESLAFAKRAAELEPGDPRYGYTHAFYAFRSGDLPGAAETLTALLERNPRHGEALALLGHIYEEQGRVEDALDIYRSGLAMDGMPPGLQKDFAERIEVLEGR